MADNVKIENGWKRTSGRRFENKNTGEIISRRQYDKRFGALAKEGFKSYEQKARANLTKGGSVNQILKPARGRLKFRGAEHEREREAARRTREKNEIATARKAMREINKSKTKKYKKLKSINNNSFKPGVKSRKFAVELSYDAINDFLNVARRNKNLFAYAVGVDFIDLSDGVRGSMYVIKTRVMSYPFTEADIDAIEDKMREKLEHYNNEIVFTGAFVYLMQKSSWVEKQNEKIKSKKSAIVQRRTSSR